MFALVDCSLDFSDQRTWALTVLESLVYFPFYRCSFSDSIHVYVCPAKFMLNNSSS